MDEDYYVILNGEKGLTLNRFSGEKGFKEYKKRIKSCSGVIVESFEGLEGISHKKGLEICRDYNHPNSRTPDWLKVFGE